MSQIVKAFLFANIWYQNCKDILKYPHILISLGFIYFNHGLPTRSKVFPAILVKII